MKYNHPNIRFYKNRKDQLSAKRLYERMGRYVVNYRDTNCEFALWVGSRQEDPK